jgi:hypothetical protein
MGKPLSMDLLALHEARRDITLDELRRELGRAGVSVAISTLHRFFARHVFGPLGEYGEESIKVDVDNGQPYFMKGWPRDSTSSEQSSE